MRLALALVSIVVTLTMVEGFFALNRRHPFLPVNPPPEIPVGRPLPLADLGISRKEVDASVKRSQAFYAQEDSVDLSEERFPGEVAPKELPYDQISRHILTRTRQEILSVRYRVDVHGRRPMPKTGVGKDRFLWFLGCSFTYGAGLEETETFAAIVGRELDLPVYNSGITGGAIHEIYERLMNPEFRFFEDVPQKKGTIIYTLIDSHIDRILCPMSCLNEENWMIYQPHYVLENGRLVHLGRHQEARPILNPVYRLLSHSAFREYFHLQWPPRLFPRDARLIVRLFAETRREFEKRFGIDHFVIALFPGQSSRASRELAPYLRAAGFDVFDYSAYDFRAQFKRRWTIPYDDHPGALAARIYARMLERDLRP